MDIDELQRDLGVVGDLSEAIAIGDLFNSAQALVDSAVRRLPKEVARRYAQLVADGDVSFEVKVVVAKATVIGIVGRVGGLELTLSPLVRRGCDELGALSQAAGVFLVTALNKVSENVRSMIGPSIQAGATTAVIVVDLSARRATLRLADRLCSILICDARLQDDAT